MTRFGSRRTPKLYQGSGGSSLRWEGRGHDLGGAAPGPIESWHLLDRTVLRHLQPGTGVGIVEGGRLAVAHDLLATDNTCRIARSLAA